MSGVNFATAQPGRKPYVTVLGGLRDRGVRCMMWLLLSLFISGISGCASFYGGTEMGGGRRGKRYCERTNR